MTNATAIVISFLLLVLGCSYFVQAKAWSRVAREALERPEAFLPIGIFVLLIGLTTVATHNVWVADWPVIVTVAGWLMTLKGAVYLLHPAVASRFSGWSDTFMERCIRFAGAVLAVLGAAAAHDALGIG